MQRKVVYRIMPYEIDGVSLWAICKDIQYRIPVCFTRTMRGAEKIVNKFIDAKSIWKYDGNGKLLEVFEL